MTTLPPLQPLTRLRAADFESAAILKATATAGRQLAELKGLAAATPNQAILINTTRASLFVKQMNPTSRAAARFVSRLHFYCSAAAIKRITSIHRARCGLDKLQAVIDAALKLRTLMKDARGGLIR